ncbi:Aminobenzoyl-glutamate utilization protein B [uncultured Eubacterium sp.]|uniref:amidohydrolase n=1 Tax=Brotomerdimonas butyrica TaxID=2981721 RepID=UPI0008202FBF|nr:amidohydrolase [Brotomerdimonas butyrica]MCU6756380.1 amidohydrolase [Brotomerdimonas butyrica]SCH81276.1 Aminobenzoyl-glutamate utilization protein B [uncultured Eubacterium sp.]
MPDLKEIKEFIIEWNEVNTADYYEASDQIWENPELSMQEYKSSQTLINLLEKAGFEVEKAVAGMPTAFIASYGSGKPVIGINCEYDALPGLSQDREKLEKAPVKQGAPGQGCGHNLLGTAGVKAATAIKEVIEKFKLPGTVKVIGAPAEELCLGKPFLGKAGYLSGYDAFLDWHPWNYTKVNYDSCQAYMSVKYHFTGRTCHGNSPWHGRSALDAAMLQGHAVEIMREHMYPGCPPDAANTINYTFVTTGPEFPSVVPDYTTAWYIGRFITTEDMEKALERITKCAEAAAMATETEVERELVTATHHKIPNRVLAECMYSNMVQVGAPDFSSEEHKKAKAIQRELGQPETGMPTEIEPFEGGYTVLCDTPEYSWNAPYATAWIAMGMKDCGWHHWGVTRCAGDTMGQKSMDCAAKVISMTAADLLYSPEILAKAHAEWMERMEGKQYQSLLFDDMEPPVNLNKDTMYKYR